MYTIKGSRLFDWGQNLKNKYPGHPLWKTVYRLGISWLQPFHTFQWCSQKAEKLCTSKGYYWIKQPGRKAQSVTCLATDACLAADPGVASSIPVRSHTFVEIDHEKFLRSFSSFLLIYSRRVVVSYKRKYVHKLLVNHWFKPAQEKVWLGELTVPQ